ERTSVHEHFGTLASGELATAPRLRVAHPLATTRCQDLAVVRLSGAGIGDGFELRHKRLLNMRVSSTITEHEATLVFTRWVSCARLVNASTMRYASSQNPLSGRLA